MLGYFLRLGTIGFGGPIATVSYMQRDLAERRGWIDRRDFLDGVGCAAHGSGESVVIACASLYR